MGETERSVRERFAERYREARVFVARCPWDAHYRTSHLDVSNSWNIQTVQRRKNVGIEIIPPFARNSGSCSHRQPEASSE